ncbi:MAG: serine/threonine protein kinase [Deltaproteobacteria bacterium]|nr:MAG: serine/threonine protein kinase [Deltaproteobacteria bacterium]
MWITFPLVEARHVTQGDPKEGDLIDGRYRLDSEIGRGGHGLVFRAYDTEAGMPVALKILNQSVTDDPAYTVRLWREAQSLAALWGTSVVQVYGFGTDETNGFVYMVMELLEGETLSDVLFEIETFGDRMNAFRVLEALDPVARALHTAHSKGIIHRDVKPPNIILLYPEVGGGTRLMDFGLAKIHGSMQLTQAGMVAGSPSYISPEVWRAKPFDHRIDVYSFAAVVYRALAGKPPFSGDSMVDILMAATMGERPKLASLRPELPPEVDQWLARALAIEAEDRYPYVSSMWNDFIGLVMRGTGPSAERAKATFSLPV